MTSWMEWNWLRSVTSLFPICRVILSILARSLLSSISALISAESPVSENSSPMAVEDCLKEAFPSTTAGLANSMICSCRSWSATKRRYAAVVTWKPPGTWKPAFANFASERPLPRQLQAHRLLCQVLLCRWTLRIFRMDFNVLGDPLYRRAYF